MPAQSQWLLRLPEIRGEIEQLTIPVLDRALFEKLFRVRRRRAHQLMHRFGGFQSGRTFWIERSAVLRELEGIESGDEFGRETRRKERLSGELDKIRRIEAASLVKVRVPTEVLNAKLPNLPEGVGLEAGKLVVLFASPEELLERLFVFAQILANDLDRFASAFGGAAKDID